VDPDPPCARREPGRARRSRARRRTCDGMTSDSRRWFLALP
jgi:hypothetical protein